MTNTGKVARARKTRYGEGQTNSQLSRYLMDDSFRSIFSSHALFMASRNRGGCSGAVVEYFVVGGKSRRWILLGPNCLPETTIQCRYPSANHVRVSHLPGISKQVT